MAKYLVTGGCGFIGSHLVAALLDSNHEVVVLDDLSTGYRDRIPEQVELVAADVAKCTELKALVGSVDGVFHLAAIASVEKCNNQWLGSHGTNASGTIAVLEASHLSSGKIPVVWASSAAVYGVQRGPFAKEDDPPAPLSPYGADKLSCEFHGSVAAKLFNVPNIGLRFFNVYGPGQDPSSPYSGVISIFMDRVRRGKGVTINGDGAAVRDFVYVGDVVSALLRSMKVLQSEACPASVSRVLNVCTGRATQIRDLFDAVCNVAGTRPMVEYGPSRPGDIHTSVGSVDALWNYLGIRCETPLVEGLVHTLGEGLQDE